jgi:hypothetical protein
VLKVDFSIVSLAGSYVVSISIITFSLLFTEILYFSISKITFCNHFSTFSQKEFNTLFTVVLGTTVHNNFLKIGSFLIYLSILFVLYQAKIPYIF